MNNNKTKAIQVYLILIFIPALFSLLLYKSILDLEKKQEINEIKFKLSERATDFMAKTTPADYFETYFHIFADEIFQKKEFNENNKDSKRNISQAIKDLNQKLNENIRCIIFDKKNEIVNPNDILPHEARFFRYIWKNIHNIPIDYKGRRSDQSLIVGWEFNSDLMKGKDSICMPISSLGKYGVFFFTNAVKPKNNTKGLIAFVEYKKSSLDFVKAKVKDYSTFNQPIILYSIANKQRETPMLGHKEITFEQTNSDEFLEGFIDNKTIWRGFVSDEYRILFGQINNIPLKYKIILYKAIAIFIAILLVSSVLFFNKLSISNGIFISIRYKLILIFILAVYIPAISLWVLSYSSLQDHKIAIENNIKKGMLDTLNKIDTDYTKTEEDVNKCFYKLDEYLKSFKGKKTPTSSEIDRKIREISGKNERVERFNWIDIRHINQSQIYTTNSNESNKRLKTIGRIISTLCLTKHCPERLDYAGVKPNQSDILVGNLLESPISGLSVLFERPREFVRMKYDGNEAVWWWNYYEDKDNPIAFCIGNYSTRFSTISYFKSLLNRRYSLNNVNLRVAFFKFSTQEFFPEYLKKNNNNDLLRLINISNVNKTVETATIKYENNDYICLCMPGSRLKECFVLCMYPISKIDSQVKKIRSDIYTLMIVLLIVSILTGLLLAKTFIVPINELSKGLNALRERDTSTTVSIENRDELGKLGQAFNQMVEGIKDMLLAGAVQQCIIPTGIHKIEGYECLIYNQMATDVGGDYADIFELPNDRLLIVIGDVTGHGVSSSLLTTMVKASVFRFAKKGVSLDEIVTNTSNMICDLLNKKKLMTFCAITLDKNTGELAICNAGHPYPIIREKDIGKIRMPSKTSIPMGVSKKRGRYTSEFETLNEGETLFIYTDGFPEAENEKGEEYTYKRFQELISNIEITNIENTKNDLLTVFKQHHGDKELADDITFIILRRNSL